MTTKFLESLASEQTEIKSIKKTLNKIYKIEVKTEKRVASQEKRERQSKKRSSGDFKIKSLLGITKTDERKSKKGILGMIGGLFKGILSIGAKPLLMMAGVGIIGTTITAYIKSEKFRNLVNEKILTPLGTAIAKSAPEMMRDAIANARFIIKPERTVPPPPSPGSSKPKSGPTKPKSGPTKPGSGSGTTQPGPVGPNVPKSGPSMNPNAPRPGTPPVSPGGRTILGANGRVAPTQLKGTTAAKAPSIPKTKVSVPKPSGGVLKSIFSPGTLKSLGLSLIINAAAEELILNPVDKALVNNISKKVSEMSDDDKQKYFQRKIKEYKKEREWQNSPWHMMEKITTFGGQTTSEMKTDTIEKILLHFGLEVEKDVSPEKLQVGGVPGDGRVKLGMMENEEYNKKSPLLQAPLKKQDGGIILFAGHTDVPAGHPQPGTDAPHTSLMGKYSPTAEQHFAKEVGVAADALAKKENAPLSYRPAKGRFENTSNPNSNWAQIKQIRKDGGSAIDLHYDAYGYDKPGGPLIQGSRGVISNGFSLTDAEKNVQGKFGRHPTGDSFGVPIVELDTINKAPGNTSTYARMLVDAAKGTGGTYKDTKAQGGNNQTTISSTQQRQMSSSVKSFSNPIEMMKNLGDSIKGFGGDFGKFVGGALSLTADAFSDSQKLQTGGVVGKKKSPKPTGYQSGGVPADNSAKPPAPSTSSPTPRPTKPKSNTPKTQGVTTRPKQPAAPQIQIKRMPRTKMQGGNSIKLSQNYHLNSMTDELQIKIPIEIPPQQNQVVSNTKQSMSRFSTTKSSGVNDLYRLSMGAAFS